MTLRQDRMADQIRDILAGCFLGGQIADSRLEGVTITAVKLSPDLQIATVYFRSYGDSSVETVKSALEHASGFLRTKLAKNLKVRRVPELRFFYDESVERGSQVEALLAELKKQQN